MQAIIQFFDEDDKLIKTASVFSKERIHNPSRNEFNKEVVYAAAAWATKQEPNCAYVRVADFLEVIELSDGIIMYPLK